MPVLLRNNYASLTWEQSCQCHLGTIVPVSDGNNFTSLTCKYLCQPHFKVIVSVSLGSIHMCKCDFGTFMLVALGNTIEPVYKQKSMKN